MPHLTLSCAQLSFPEVPGVVFANAILDVNTVTIRCDVVGKLHLFIYYNCFTSAATYPSNPIRTGDAASSDVTPAQLQGNLWQLIQNILSASLKTDVSNIQI